MVTFDKLKLVASIDAIEVIDEDKFQKEVKSGRPVSLRYFQEVPFLLLVKVDFLRHEVVVEFCGKVLGKEYPKLISSDTIKTCFDNINALGYFHLDIDAMMEADVVKADVTKDVRGIDAKQLNSYIGSHITNYKMYLCQTFKNGNLVINKNVTSSKAKKRMTIYDKAKEMDKAKNKDFVEAHHLEHAFDNTSRIELNLNSKQQVREALHIPDNKLSSVLASTASPIRDFVTKVIEPTSNPVDLSDRKTYITMLVLKDCDFDLEKVEAKIRELYPNRGRKLKTLMEPYRSMMSQMRGENTDEFYQTLLAKLA